MDSLPLGSPAYPAYLLVFAVAAAGCLAGAWRARRQVSLPGVRRGLVGLLFTSGLWALCHVGVLLSPGLGLKVAFYEVGLTVGFATVWAWLWLCSSYSGRALHRRAAVRWAAFVVFAAVTLTKLTNPWHGLYFSAELSAVPFRHLEVDHHVIYWITVGLSYALAAVGFFMLAEPLRRAKVGGGKLAGLFGLTALPLGANAIGYATPYLLGLSHEPIGVAAFALGAFALRGSPSSGSPSGGSRRGSQRGSRLEEASRAGREKRPSLVLSEGGRIRNYNRAAEELFPALRGEDISLEERGLRKQGASQEQGAPQVQEGSRGQGVFQGQEVFQGRKVVGRPVEEVLPRLAQALEAQALKAQAGEVGGDEAEARADSMSAMGTPMMGTPMMETPVMETPVMETPVMETPVMEREAEKCMFGHSYMSGHNVAPRENAPENGEDWPEKRRKGTWGRPDGALLEAEGCGGDVRYFSLTESTFQQGSRRLVTLADVTERELRRQVAEKERRSFREVIEQANESVVITGAEPLEGQGPRIQYVNAAFEEMTGYSRSEVVGKTPQMLHGPETDPSVLESMEEALAAEQQWEGETMNYGKNGEPYRVRWNVSPVRGPDGEVKCWVSAQQDVTERRRREEEIERKNDLFEKAQEIADVGAWEYDAKADRLIWTDQVYEIYGLPTGADLTVEKVIGLFHPDDRQALRTAFQKALEEATPYRKEMRIVTPEEEVKWVLAHGEAQTENGEVVRIRGTVQDITERKRREKTLRKLREKYQGLLEGAPDAIFVAGAQSGQVVEANQAAASLLGIPAEEIAGRHQSELHPSGEEEKYRSLFETAMKEAEAEAMSFTQLEDGSQIYVETDSGEKVPVEISATTVDLSGGEHSGRGQETGKVFVGIFRDITERKKREQDLRERREKGEALFEATRRLLTAETREAVAGRIHEVLEGVFDYPFVHVGLEEDGLIVPRKTAAAGLSRKPETEAQPMSEDLVVTRALQAGEAVVVDDTGNLENGIDYGSLSSLAGIPIGERGAIVLGKEQEKTFRQFDLHLVEVMARYAALVLGRLGREEALRAAKEESEEAKEKAEDARRMQSAFLANMSHEIRTPLTSIIGFAEVLGAKADELKLPSESSVPRYASMIEKGGKRLLETLEGVLNLSKLQAGQMEMETGPVDLARQARLAAEELRPEAEEKGIGLELETGGLALAEADEGGVQIALRNLLSNAIKYTEEGSVTVRTYREDGQAEGEKQSEGDKQFEGEKQAEGGGKTKERGQAPKNGQALKGRVSKVGRAAATVLEVEDTGIGMDPEAAGTLFEPFRQASEGFSREYEGTGIGLAVTKEAVSQMGGSIEVETEKGEGTCVTVRLPLAGQAETA